MKTLMIMGAGIYQVPLIKTAKRMGIHTIAVSIPGKYPGFAYADEVLHINTVDSGAVLAAAREKKIDGICTAGTDVAVMTIGRVNDALGLSGISYEAARLACDKVQMKECYEANGVRTARYRKVYFNENVNKKITGLNYPLIVKIVDSSVSRGITRVDTPEELPDAIRNAQSYTRKDYYIVEEFIVGQEFGTQFLKANGDKYFISYAKIAEGYGVESICVNSAEEFKPALEKAMQANREGRPFLVEAPMENIVVPTPGCWNINDIYSPNELVREGKLVKKENGKYVAPSHAKSHNAK